MQKLFIRIYGSILISIISILLVSYIALNTLNQYRYEHYLKETMSGTVYLLTLGAERQDGDNQTRWLALASSLMGIEVSVLANSESLSAPHDSQIRGTGKNRFQITKQLQQGNIQLSVNFETLTEEILTATGFLLLNEIGRHPVDSRQAVFEKIAAEFSFPISRVERNYFDFDSSQIERLDRAETIVEWDKRYGRSMSFNVYTPWGNTSDVLAMGAVAAFDPYPNNIVLGFFLTSMLLMAVIVMLIIKHMAARLKKIQQQVDAISPDFPQVVKKGTDENDAITLLNVKIKSMAQRIQKLLDEKAYMIRAISHDLRTPIAKLHFRLEGLSELINQDNSMLSGCKKDLEQLNSLIDELLTYEKLSIKQNVEFSDINIVELATDQVQNAGMLFPDVHFVVDSRLDQKLTVYANKVLVCRMFENLLNNAGRYARHDVQVTLKTENQALVIVVDDDGSGLDEQNVEALFDPFFQADAARGDSANYGLGLAIVKQVAMQHGATVSACNNEKGGARFIFTFSVDATRQVESE